MLLFELLLFDFKGKIFFLHNGHMWPVVIGWGMEIFAEKLQLIIYENIIQQINSGTNIINI